MSASANSGELALRALPAVLLDFNETFANGRLSIRRGKVLKHFDLVNGNPMSAASTPRDETLGHFLVANGVITDDVHQQAVTKALVSGDRLGETLVAMRAMSLETLFEQLRRQARFKLIASLRWPQGTWRFDPSVISTGGMALRMTDVVLLGLKETSAEDGVRLSRFDNMTFQLNARGVRLRSDLRRAFGDEIVESLDDWTRLAAIETSVGDSVRARSALDAMMLCDALDSKAAAIVQPRPVTNQGTIALVDEDEDFAMPTMPRGPRSDAVVDSQPLAKIPSVSAVKSGAPGTGVGTAGAMARALTAIPAMPAIPSIRAKTVDAPVASVAVPVPVKPASRAATVIPAIVSVKPTGNVPPAPVTPVPRTPPVVPTPLTPPVPPTVAASVMPVTTATTEPSQEDRIASETLVDELFDGMAQLTSEGSIPIAVTDADESGVVAMDVVSTAQVQSAEASNIRRKVAAEHVRIRGLDFYGVLMIARNATSAEVSVAVADRRSEFSRDFLSRYGLGLDQHKLDELHDAYQLAYDTLLDDAARRAYDQELAGGELPVAAASFAADLKFRIAEQLMREQRWDEAVTALTQVAATAGDEADYLAALGWALWHQQGKVGAAIDAARSTLNAALAANPDHAGAHQYRGILEAGVGEDLEGALFHLERAVEIDASRVLALDYLERILIGRGELRRIERICKRTVFRVAGTGADEVVGWLRLLRVFQALDEPASARSALRSAEAIAPNAPEVVKARKALDNREGSQRDAVDPSTTSGWDQNPVVASITKSGAVRRASAAAAVDANFVQAACEVALLGTTGAIDPQIAARYARHRRLAVRFPATPLEAHHWARLRHPSDTVELGALVELLAPVIERTSPLTYADVELDVAMRLDSHVIPVVFARIVHECARLLDVAVPAIFSRPELGNQIHVVAVSPPVLVAGDEALTALERPDLVFQVVRALSLTTPGRAVGGSRPGRVLRAAAMAAFGEATGTAAPVADTAVVAASQQIHDLPSGQRNQLRALAQRFLARGQALDLSAWSRSLVRTADRVGLLLCGDVPAAFTAARELGDLHQDLIDFARSPRHAELRQALNLMVD